MIRNFTWSGVSQGYFCRTSAAMPLTTAAACDVPDIVYSTSLAARYWLNVVERRSSSSMIPRMCPPGATTSGLTKPSVVGPVEENEQSLSSVGSEGVELSGIAPTARAYGLFPGRPMVIGFGP